MRSGRLRLPVLAMAAVLAAACSAGTGSAAPSNGPGPAAPSPAAGQTAAAPPASPGTSPPEAFANLQRLLDDERASYGSVGALAVLRLHGREISVSSGTADAAGTAITGTTRFRVGSITKPLVATLVLLAVSRGQLSLDDVVADVLPGILRPTPAFTVRQMLDHTSGLFDEGNEGDEVADIARLTDPSLQAQARNVLADYQAGKHPIVPAPIFVALAETHDRCFAPGEGYHYSNTNYQLAVMLLEHVTGTTFPELLRSGIAERLALTHTTVAPPDLASPEFRGYAKASADAEAVDATDDLLVFGNGGNGGVLSTAGELLTTMQALVSGRLLPADLTAEMRRPTTVSYGAYGLGLGTYPFSCGEFYGHAGSVNGTRSIAVVSSDGADGFVAAFNLTTVPDTAHLESLADRALCGEG